MSKDRARRRAEREAAAAAERADRERTAARRKRLLALRERLLPRRAPARRPDSALARQRSRQNGVLAAVLVGLHTVVWLLWPSWWVRGSALVLTVLLWPLLVVLLYDRRPTA